MKKKLIVLCAEYNITKEIGGICFKKGGDFFMSNQDLRANICRSGTKDRHIVYAHVIDDEVVYIGESSHSFRDRMRLYICHEGSTNVRVRKFIKEKLTEGKKVEIYYYKPKTIVVDNVLVVNPYVGIEQALIRIIGKKLNKKDVA